MGRLIVCGTPIGNLEDASHRLRASLSGADMVFAEDTRRTAKLLSHLAISTPVRSLFVGNENERSAELAREVEGGKVVALVTDAGMPTVSDPGAVAVRLVREAGFPITVVPGPSAVSAALALSGFSADGFSFEGFLPRKGQERSRRLTRIAGEERPVVLFASPQRLGNDLADLFGACGDRPVVVTRELTKLHEEAWSGDLEEAVDHWKSGTRGEVTLVLGPVAPVGVSLSEGVRRARELIVEGESISSAARQASTETGVSRRRIYEELVNGQEAS